MGEKGTSTGGREGLSARSGRRRIIVLSLAAVALGALPGRAQTDSKPFSPQELDQILAPIALYPDALLSQVLMASTYPLEIVEAARWSQANPNLKGDDAVKAVGDKSWDVSVKSLVAFPPVLAQLNEHLDWTQKLGDAFIGQQQDVAVSIQRLRAKAADAGNLKSGKEQAVKVESQGSERIIVIEPADPQIIYVPTYNPNTVYGAWPYPSYPPTYYPVGSALLSGFAWGVGFAAAGAMFGGWHWGYGAGNSYTNINVNRAVNIDRNFNRTNVGAGDRWQHDVDHRKGVAYRDNATRQQFGQTRPGVDQREQFRGQVQQGARPGTAAGAGQRPNAGAQPRAPGNAGGLSGVDRGQQVNREAQRGRTQQQRAATPRSGGGGGGAGGGARPTTGGGGGGGRPGGGGGGQAGGGGRR